MIYSTPFDQTKVATGPSTPAGFQSLAAVKAALGGPVHEGGRVLVYGTGDNQVAFSDFIFAAEEDYVPESHVPHAGGS